MNWKTTLASMALAASALIPSAAQADGPHIGVSVSLPPMGVHIHGSGCDHDEVPPQPPMGTPQQTGRYELRTVSEWVPGYYEQVWVQGQCFTRHKKWRTRTVCTDGYYEDRWVEGRYQQVEKWVWVEYARPTYGYGRHLATRVR